MNKRERNKPQPLQWADKFLHLRLSEEAAEEVIGDLHELFDQWVLQMGEGRARRRYGMNTLVFLRPLPQRLRKKKK